MTEEELNRFEEMSLDVGRCIGMAHNAILSLIRLARVGLAADRLSAIADEANAVSLKQHVHHGSALPKPGGE